MEKERKFFKKELDVDYFIKGKNPETIEISDKLFNNTKKLLKTLNVDKKDLKIVATSDGIIEITYCENDLNYLIIVSEGLYNELAYKDGELIKTKQHIFPFS